MIVQVESVDEVLQKQSHFLDKCLKDCLLTNLELLRTLTKITNICASFANFILVSTTGFVIADIL